VADGSVYPRRGTGEILGLAVEATTGTIAIRASFPNPENLLRPGQYAKVRFPIEVRKGALLVQQRAVRDTQGLLQVGVVGADGTVSLRSVEVGERVGSLWMVERGLAPGDGIIVRGVEEGRAGG